MQDDYKYGLYFCQSAVNTSELLSGRLDILSLRDFRVISRFKVSSGRPWLQNWDDQMRKGGPLPRQDKAGIQRYMVETTGLPESTDPGIDGQFFQILPKLVTLMNGNQRSEFGIHIDANESVAPGSIGCIVFPASGFFREFINEMKKIRAEGFNEIPLLVEYVD